MNGLIKTAVIISLLALLAGCGKKGDLEPPERHKSLVEIPHTVKG